MAKFNALSPDFMKFAAEGKYTDITVAKKAYLKSLAGETVSGKRGRPENWKAPAILALFYRGQTLVETVECVDTRLSREGAILTAVNGDADLLKDGLVVFTRPIRKSVNVKTGEITMENALIQSSMDLVTGFEIKEATLPVSEEEEETAPEQAASAA